MTTNASFHIQPMTLPLICLPGACSKLQFRSEASEQAPDFGDAHQDAQFVDRLPSAKVVEMKVYVTSCLQGEAPDASIEYEHIRLSCHLAAKDDFLPLRSVPLSSIIPEWHRSSPPASLAVESFQKAFGDAAQPIVLPDGTIQDNLHIRSTNIPVSDVVCLKKFDPLLPLWLRHRNDNANNNLPLQAVAHPKELEHPLARSRSPGVRIPEVRIADRKAAIACRTGVQPPLAECKGGEKAMEPQPAEGDLNDMPARQHATLHQTGSEAASASRKASTGRPCIGKRARLKLRLETIRTRIADHPYNSDMKAIWLPTTYSAEARQYINRDLRRVFQIDPA